MIHYRNILAIVAILAYVACGDQTGETEYEEEGTNLTKEQRIKYALEEDFRRTKDPNLGYPPKERLYTAIQESRIMQKISLQRRNEGQIAPTFTERGPIDIGGRTRAIHIDLTDPERKKIWSGSVSGGLFVTEDITSAQPQWSKVNDYLDNLAVSSIVQDPNDPSIMYMGTGEGFVNGDAVRGFGIFKSEDGGETWRLLESTIPNSGAHPFAYTRSMLIHPTTSHVYAATRFGGVLRSEDGGATWTKVLGLGLTAGDDSTYDVKYAGGRLYASTDSEVYMSDTGDSGGWVHISRPGSDLPNNWSRCEIAVCPTDNQILYAVGAINGGGSPVYKTTDGGQSWSNIGLPGGGDYTNGQAWYDLDVAVNPFDCNRVVIGGVPLYQSATGGNNWGRLPHSSYQTSIGHVDQHIIVFDEEQPGVVYFGNDGGIWRSQDGNAQSIQDKNLGYITTQYYGCAIHPDSFSNYMLGGTQDNGTHQLNDFGLASGRNVWGGDGFLAHIDQNDPNYQMVSSQFGRWGLSRNGGITFSQGVNTNSNFLTPSDYDSDAGILYTQTRDGDFYRWNVKTGLFELVNWEGAPGGNVSTVAVDPYTPNRVYFGTFSGRIIRVDNAHEGNPVQAEVVFQNANRVISSVAVAHESPDQLIATVSNYGVNNSVLVSRDTGQTWFNCEGNLPDMPVRWGIFNPKDPSEALIATEAGVWSTAELNGSATIWDPPLPGEGTPIVRTDQLDWRESDFTVIAGTHGRGLWTSNVFSEPRAKFVAPQVHYVNSPLRFVGEVSLNAQSYAWDFGDGSTSEDENPVHTFSEVGEYEVELTVNGTLKTSSRIKILSSEELPYTTDRPRYGGGFDAFDEQYGTEVFNGSQFEVGNSQALGKAGVRSGDAAMVLAPGDDFYAPNTNASFYLPQFDFSDESIYTFSFYAKHWIQGSDGFIVEYTRDGGQTWQILGSQGGSWYNSSVGVEGAWPNSVPYFTKEEPNFQRYATDVSFLSGESNVAFRFQFRSDATGFHPGVVIDDVEITKFEGELVTNITTFSGDFVGADTDIELTWTTLPEYFCDRFEVQRSTNGRDFETVNTVNARSGLSDRELTYKWKDNQGGSLYFYRLKVINENAEENYFLEFFSDTITVRRSGVNPGEIFTTSSGPRIFPNPFNDEINVTFTSSLEQNVRFEIFDLSGRIVLDREVFVDNAFTRLEVFDIPAGTYYLAIQIGENERKVYPVVKPQ